MKIAKKWIGFSLLVVFLAALALPWIIQSLLTPSRVQERIAHLLNAQVKIKTVSYSLFSGISIREMEIRRSMLSLTVPYVHTRVSLLAYLRGRLELTQLSLEGPCLEKTFSLKDESTQAPLSSNVHPGSFDMMPFRADGIVVRNGRGLVHFPALEKSFSFSDAEGETSSVQGIGVPFHCRFKLKTKDLSIEKYSSSVSLDAVFSLGPGGKIAQEGKASLRIDAFDLQVLHFLQPYFPSISRLSGTSSYEGEVDTRPDREISTGKMAIKPLAVQPFSFEKGDMELIVRREKGNRMVTNVKGRVFAKEGVFDTTASWSIELPRKKGTPVSIDISLHDFPFEIFPRSPQHSEGIYGIQGSLPEFRGKIELGAQRVSVQGSGRVSQLRGKGVKIGSVVLGDMGIRLDFSQEKQTIALTHLVLEEPQKRISIRGNLEQAFPSLESNLKIEVGWHGDFPVALKNVLQQEKLISKGKHFIVCDVRGDLCNLARLTANAKMDSERIEYGQMGIEGLTGEFKTHAGQIGCLMKGKLNEGTLKMLVKTNLKEAPNNLWSGKVEMERVKLNPDFFASLRYVTPVFYVPEGKGAQEITGDLSTALSFETSGNETALLRKNLKGEGNVTIHDGALSGPPVLVRLLGLLGLENLRYRFKTMTGALRFQEEVIHTNQLEFQGNPLSFKMNGKTNFDGNISFTLETVSLKGMGVRLPVNVGKLVTVQIAGSWYDPTLSLKLPKIKGIGDLIEKGLDIFGE